MSPHPATAGPTVSWPEAPGFYGYLQYHEFFFGPFATLDEAKACYARGKAADSYFDYDGWMIAHCQRRPADIKEFWEMGIPRSEWDVH